MDSPMLTLLVARGRGARPLEDALRVSTQKVVSLSSAESEYYSMVRCASEAHWIGQHDTRAWTRSSSANLNRCCSGARTGSPKRDRRNQAYWKRSAFGCSRKRRTRSSGIDKIRDTVNPADLMTKHPDGKRLVMLCELLNIKRRPSSAPKLTIDTEYISRASRALAAVTLVKRATGNRCCILEPCKKRGSMDTEQMVGQ